jgi:magnesium chelatase subunit D
LPPAVEAVRVDVAQIFERKLPRDSLERARLGRRARSLVSLRKGKYARPRLPRGPVADVAVDATLRAAAIRQRRGPIAVEAGDLRRKLRFHRSPFAVCFVLDNSWSIHADRMVERAKGVVLRLLEDATTRGDRISLVAFRGGVPEATVVLPPTSSLALAYKRLRRIPLSGQTPLADALRRARIVLRQELFKYPNAVPLVVVVTDGLPTVPLVRGGDALGDVLAEARRLKRERILCVVADTAPDAGGAAAEIARAAGGDHVLLEQLAAESLVDALERIA